MEMIKINIDGILYDAFINRKRIKRIIMKVNALLQINISCPLFVSHNKCLEFIERNTEWLRKTIIEKNEVYQKMHVEECLEKKGIWLKGKYFIFKKTENIEKFYSFDEQNIFIPNTQMISMKFIEKIKAPLYSEIEDLFEYYKTSYPDIIPKNSSLIMKKLKSKWGSCNYKKNIITINKVLVSVPENLLHFVLIHEFLHFLFPNHGKNFKNKLNSFSPNNKVLEKELKNYNFLLEKDIF